MSVRSLVGCILLVAGCSETAGVSGGSVTAPSTRSDRFPGAANLERFRSLASSRDAGAADSGPPELPSNGEVCDGLDNDNNGAIDDADIEGDGVCDCLKIASIGGGGASSSGKLVFRDWPNARAQNPVVALNDQPLSDELLAPYDVIVLLNVATAPVSGGDPNMPIHPEFSDDEVASFERWIRGGGGAITTIGYSADEAREVGNVNRLLAPFGMAYSDAKLYVDGYVEDWVEHPVTEGVHKIYTENGAEPDGSDGLTLAHDTNGHVALQATQSDDARILVWGDEWITYASQWQDKSDQQVQRLWLNSLAWLSRSQSCQKAIDITDISDADASVE